MSVSIMDDEVGCLLDFFGQSKHDKTTWAKISNSATSAIAGCDATLGAGRGYLSQDPEVDKLFEDMDIIAFDESEGDFLTFRFV